MAKIIIGKEYERAFESICRLVGSGCIPPEIVKSANGREIVTDAYTFEYAGDEKGLNVEGGAATAAGMTAEGATWFSALRGKAHDDGTAVWLNLIESVAASYHKRYSLIEYKQNARKVSDAEKELCRRALENIAGRFFEDLPAVEVREGSREDGTEDIYGVSVRIELSGGTGAAVPVLAKVYFRRRGRKLYPLFEEEAKKIDEYLYEIIPSGDGGKKPDNSDASGTIDAVLGAMEDLLYGKTAGFDFTRCVCYSGEEDEKIVSELAEKVSHDNVRLECRQVSTLGISHVRWINSSYIVYSEQKPVLRATVGLNDSISLSCLNCNAGVLVENNRVSYTVPGEDGEAQERAVFIDPRKEDLGITDEQAEEIAGYSEFARHLQYVSCYENTRVAGGCTRCVCAAQQENLGSEEEPVFKCKDCPYPEVVFTDGSGARRYTPRLVFARDKMTMIDKSEAAVCDCCGRTYSKESMQGRLCPFCHSAFAGVSDGERELAKKRYKRYAHMFSPFVRLKYLGKEKLCFEEEDVLLFLLGDDRYTFDKLSIGEYGYISKPHKVQE